jgi:hypothetical protein
VHYSSWLCKYTWCITCTAPVTSNFALSTERVVYTLSIDHATYMQALGPVHDSSSCSMACSGNAAEMCGGGMTNNLYRVVPCASKYAVPGEYAQPVLAQLLHVRRDHLIKSTCTHTTYGTNVIIGLCACSCTVFLAAAPPYGDKPPLV